VSDVRQVLYWARWISVGGLVLLGAWFTDLWVPRAAAYLLYESNWTIARHSVFFLVLVPSAVIGLGARIAPSQSRLVCLLLGVAMVALIAGSSIRHLPYVEGSPEYLSVLCAVVVECLVAIVITSFTYRAIPGGRASSRKRSARRGTRSFPMIE